MSEYRYATARIRVMETRLVSRNTVERLLEAPGAEDAVKVLSDTEYGTYFGEISAVSGFEKAINRHLADIYKVVEDSTRRLDFTRIFRYRYDFHNLKVLIKADYTGEKYEEILIPLGTVEISRLEKAVQEKEFADLPVFFREAVEETLTELELNGRPRFIDYLLDRSYYRVILDTAAELGRFAVEFVRTEIDLSNINTFLRVRKAGFGGDVLRDALIEGGFLQRKFYLDNLIESLDSFSAALSFGRYEKLASAGIQGWLEDRDATQLEKALDNYLLELAREGLFAASGVKPILGFLKAKESEARLIRLIMVSKINRIPVEKIRERLRDTYV